MKKLHYFVFLLFIFFILIKYSNSNSNSNYKMELFKEFIEPYNNTDSYKILFKNIKYFNNYFYRNIPRKSYSESNITFEIYNDTAYVEWPYDYNDNKDLSNCRKFISIISFEFDEENNIYLLDEGTSNCPIKIIIFNSTGDFLDLYTIYNKTNQNINLTNFIIDKINNFFYIPFTNSSGDEYEVGIFVKEMGGNRNRKIITLNNTKYLFEEKYTNYADIFMQYNISDKILDQKILINIALSCDAEYLLISSLSSRMIYSISTEQLRESKAETSIDIKKAYKNDISSALISSNLGNLYLTGLEKNLIYRAGQIDYDLSIFDFKILDEINNNNNIHEFPTDLSIINGTLFIKYINIFENETNLAFIQTKIYNISIDKEESYIFKCGGLIYKWNWKAYIIWGFFFIIFCLIIAFVYIGNQQDIDINKNK